MKAKNPAQSLLNLRNKLYVSKRRIPKHKLPIYEVLDQKKVILSARISFASQVMITTLIKGRDI